MGWFFVTGAAGAATALCGSCAAADSWLCAQACPVRVKATAAIVEQHSSSVPPQRVSTTLLAFFELSGEHFDKGGDTHHEFMRHLSWGCEHERATPGCNRSLWSFAATQ